MIEALALASFLASAGSQCAELPRVASGVAALHEEVLESEPFTLAEIQDMARRSGQALAHPALGFYLAGFGHSYETRTVTDTSPGGARCSTLTTIIVRLALVDRVVAVASDLRQRGCNRDAVARHYLKHAAADDKALSKGVQVLNKALAEAWPAIRATLPMSGVPNEEDLRAAIEPVVASALNAIEQARKAEGAEVDSATEVLAMATACTSPS